MGTNNGRTRSEIRAVVTWSEDDQYCLELWFLIFCSVVTSSALSCPALVRKLDENNSVYSFPVLFSLARFVRHSLQTGIRTWRSEGKFGRGKYSGAVQSFSNLSADMCAYQWNLCMRSILTEVLCGRLASCYMFTSVRKEIHLHLLWSWTPP